MCAGRNRFPEPEDALLGHDDPDVRFALIGGHTFTPEVFLAKTMNGRASQRSAKAFSPAMARARRNLAISLPNLTRSADGPGDMRTPKNRIMRFPINKRLFPGIRRTGGDQPVHCHTFGLRL